jgi:hypothetical protein
MTMDFLIMTSQRRFRSCHLGDGAPPGRIAEDYTPPMKAFPAVTALLLGLLTGCRGVAVDAMLAGDQMGARRPDVLKEPARPGSEGAPKQSSPASPPPPDAEIYLAPLTRENGRVTVGTAVNITNNPGYDNQPFFSSDGRSILFTSMRPSPALSGGSGAPQTDIFRYDLASQAIVRVTQTPESEYSPTPMLDGRRLSVVRVEADGTQRLASITPDGPTIQMDVILPDVKPVGYHAWADDQTLALFVLGANRAPATLQLGDTRTGRARVVATDVGRSILRMPGTGPSRHISFVQRERAGETTTLVVKELDPATGAITALTPSVAGSREADLAWMPDGTLLMAKDEELFAWRRGDAAWTPVADLSRLGLRSVSRLAVSPQGDRLALVGLPPKTR